MDAWLKDNIKDWKFKFDDYRSDISKESVEIKKREINLNTYLLTKIADILYIIACGIRRIEENTRTKND